MAFGISNVYVSTVLEQVVINVQLTYCPGCATLFYFVVVHNGSKLSAGRKGG